MICNCFNEAGNQEVEGQVAVGEVVMTRVGAEQWPDGICEVITQDQQFSWYNQLSSRTSVPEGHSCVEAMNQAMGFRGCVADHYHADYVNPRWNQEMTKLSQLQDHIFYSRYCGSADQNEFAAKQEAAAQGAGDFPTYVASVITGGDVTGSGNTRYASAGSYGRPNSLSFTTGSPAPARYRNNRRSVVL